MTSIRVAIVGVGNCASSFVQVVTAARQSDLEPFGLVHPRVGPYGVADIEFVAAFDIDRRKVGVDLSEAVVAEPNCTTVYVDVPHIGVDVAMGTGSDGVGRTLSAVVQPVDNVAVTVDDIVEQLVGADVEVMVLFLPTGSSATARLYAEAALQARVALVNCIPEAIATDEQWAARFAEAKVPVLGDDVRSQLGATRLHRALLELCGHVAAQVDRTYQLNFGGNTDFLNMFDPDRAQTKRRSKLAAVAELLPEGGALSAGPSGYVEFLGDQKVAYIRIEGRLLMGMPFSVETRLQVEDSPNAAGVVIDAVRAARVALDRSEAGPVTDVCSYLFKKPPVLASHHDAEVMFHAFAAGE